MLEAPVSFSQIEDIERSMLQPWLRKKYNRATRPSWIGMRTWNDGIRTWDVGQTVRKTILDMLLAIQREHDEELAKIRAENEMLRRRCCYLGG